MIYFLIALLATTIGGVAGMGGGLIIKPMLDLLGDDISIVAVLSSVTVLSMCVVSVIKRTRVGFKIDKQMIFLTGGALVGGVLGNLLFNFALTRVSDETVNILQIVIVLVLMIFALFKDFFGKANFKHPAAFIIAGLLLGAVSTFVGIGGGPKNVAVLVVFFGFDIKRAAITSLFIIMFAQLVNVITMMAKGDVFQYDLSALWFMVPAAIIGGLIGAFISKKLKAKHVNFVFVVVVCGIIALNVYNLVTLL